METWDEMTTRHSKERAEMEERHAEKMYWMNVEEKSREELLNFADQIKQEDAKMIARHYEEAKQHPETPDLTVSLEDKFKPKNPISLDEHLKQQKTEEQKLMDELREAVAKEKDVFQKELEREAKEQAQKKEQDERAAELLRQYREKQAERERNRDKGLDWDR